ncbi:MAG: rubrerythrin family protein [Phycisphaerae bacterium]
MANALTKTLENLQAAFNGESNAHAKYLVYAQAAAAEGYHGVAKLFEAAALAERFHARNHAEVITKLGGTPKADIKTPAAQSTRENLADALQGEVYERDVMYPDFIKEALVSKISAANRTFTFALKAEAEHAKLYQEALDHLEDWRAQRTFLVCDLCGYTVLVLAGNKCPVCGNPKEKFTTIA